MLAFIAGSPAIFMVSCGVSKTETFSHNNIVKSETGDSEQLIVFSSVLVNG
jgi:hypothetical protein